MDKLGETEKTTSPSGVTPIAVLKRLIHDNKENIRLFQLLYYISWQIDPESQTIVTVLDY